MWRDIQRQNFTDWKKLLSFLELDQISDDILKKSPFSLNLPQRLARKIEKGRSDDPLLLQFLPTTRELERNEQFVMDPVGDKGAAKTSKLLHKYQGRALLVMTSACAMHCRFCFRQHYAYEKEQKSFERELDQIAKDSSLSEIILSGGDPLSLSNEVLGALIEKLSAIPHLKRVRWHTRFPIGIPERIDEGFLSILQSSRLQTIFVIHCNHARELDEEIIKALKNIQQLGYPVLCQSVLLKGVNDTITTLQTLFESLVNVGIIPYYLHQLDRVQGAAHFEVPLEEGKKLIEQLRSYLPGYAIPSYVAEIPQEPSKTPL
jgi:lysine 2,3-aminomutase